MKKTKWVRYSLIVAGMLLILVSLSACEDKRDDLLDRESAGVWVQYNSNNSDLPGDSIIDIELDKQGDLWISCSGKGVTRYHDGIWTTYNTSNCSILNDTVTVLEATNDGRLLAGTVNGLAIRSPGGDWSSFKDPAVPAMYITSVKEASDGTIWIGTYNQGYYLYYGSLFLHSTIREDIFAFEEDSKGNFWLGASFGLAKFDGTKWSYINTSNGLPDGEVTKLFIDSKERLWISVFFNKAIFWLDINNSDVKEVSLMDGMSVNLINDIYVAILQRI
ncbi:MAG: hypothetical protein NTZ85_03955 [Bacteroidia bacterium]|nr:hypothetical protein [Bacteroidia bacterium]